MASQIEQTVASLTALSEQYSAQLEGFFKKNDVWFQGLRTSTLANLKSALQKIESHASQHRSPVKSLRKKVRRKVRKGTRVRKNKNKTNLRSPVVNAYGQQLGADASNSRTRGVLVLSPSRQLHMNARKETEVEAPPSISPTSAQHPVSKSTEEKAESNTFPSATIQKKHSSGTSRSTGSFHSAVDTRTLPQSPPNEESQWEDCQSKFEFVALEPTNHASKREASEMESSDSVEQVPQIAHPSEENDVPPKSQAFGESQVLNCADEVRGSVNLDEKIDRTLESSEEQDIQVEIRRETQNITEESARDTSSEGEESSHAGNHEDTPDCNLAKSETGDEGRISSDVPLTALAAALQKERKTESPKSGPLEITENETLVRRSPEAHGNQAKSEADKLHSEDLKGDQFEFKAPKPRSIATDQSPHSGQGSVGPAADLQPVVHQTPTQAVKRNPQTKEKKHTLYERHFTVDDGGKIDDAGIGLLSEIASTPATSAKGNKPDTQNSHEEGRGRGTKLFKPNNDIYSAQRKPALSRVLSVQKSTLTSRGSLLSHTPGAHAPSTRLARDSTLSGMFTSNLRESLAALKQPITDRNPTHAMEDDEPPLEDSQGSQEPVFLRDKEQDSQGIPVGKRLTFADGYKRQFESGLSQSSRGFEPQTAPTKDFRQPRIRRDTEKSALRRRIEEIRGKASSLSVAYQASPRASSSSYVADNLSGSDQDDKTSTVAKMDMTVEVESDTLEGNRKSTGTSKVSTDAEKASTKMSIEIVPNSTWVQESVSSSGVENENSEKGEKISPQKEMETERDSTAEGEVVEVEDEDEFESGGRGEVEVTQERGAPKNVISNLMTSVSSLYSGPSILGTRTHEEKRVDTDGEQAAKRQKLDAERREAERLARMEAQRAVRQKEAEEKQRRAEARRQLLAEAEKAKEEERKRKEVHRKKVKQQEEEERKRKKLEDDRKKEERRRHVLEKRALNLELQGKRKAVDGKRQRQIKLGDRGMSGIPKPNGLGGKFGKVHAGGRTAEAEREMNSYDMTPAKATVIEESDEETERRKGKTIPEWAGERNLAISARSQPDPDKVFVNMPMCNLKDVFGNQKQYRTRSSSANWTHDRVTSSEMTRYKKSVGGFRDA